MMKFSGRAARAAVAIVACAFVAACASAPENTGVKVPQSGGTAVDKTSQSYFQSAVGDRVYFATDTTTLSDDAKAVLARQAQWLMANPGRNVRIEGHADERGTREYNIALGARRAEAVKNFLLAQGVSASRVGTVSYGRERPVEVCSNDACWARNRRAVTKPL